MAVLHCSKCGRELWFHPGRRKRRDFSHVICLCGVRFYPHENGRVKRTHTPNIGATTVDSDRSWTAPRKHPLCGVPKGHRS